MKPRVVPLWHRLKRGDFHLDNVALRSGINWARCLLYTSDAADDTPCVDLGGRRIIKKKKKKKKKNK